MPYPGKGDEMGKNRVPNVEVDTDAFKAYLSYRKTPIAGLARAVGVNPRYLYQSMHDGHISLAVAVDICEYFACGMETVFGSQDLSDARAFARLVLQHS